MIRPIGSALAHKYGKRPQFIFATIMGFIGTLVCCTTSDNYNVILAGRIIQGFSSAVFGSFTVAVMGDMCVNLTSCLRLTTLTGRIKGVSFTSDLSGLVC